METSSQWNHWIRKHHPNPGTANGGHDSSHATRGHTDHVESNNEHSSQVISNQPFQINELSHQRLDLSVDMKTLLDQNRQTISCLETLTTHLASNSTPPTVISLQGVDRATTNQTVLTISYQNLPITSTLLFTVHNISRTRL